MSKKESGEPLMQDGAPIDNGPPAYPGQPNYMVSPQQGYVIHGQPAHQGYIVQSPPPYGSQYNAPGTVTTVLPQRPAEDHMIGAILVTLFCFFPTGILAIMRASDARAAALYGDVQSADRHSKSAKKMIKISIIAGIVTTVILVGLMIVYIAIISHMAARKVDYD